MNNYIVYAHINKENGKSYIGITSRDPNIRWGLNGNGYKDQPKFYNAIQKYGWDNFIHTILNKELTEEEALELETYYIKKYNSINNGYNILLKGIKSYPRNKKVFCLTTKILYNSIKEAALANQTTPTRIIENCKGKNSGTKGLEWTYWDDINNQPLSKPSFIKKNPSNAVQIYCIELNKYYNSIAEASRELNIDKDSLQKAINGIRNGAKGYHFVRAGEENKIKEKLSKKTGKQRIIYCEETKQFFNSLEEAAIFCNRTPQSVMKNCQGKNKTCAGYHFKYKEDLYKDE